MAQLNQKLVVLVVVIVAIVIVSIVVFRRNYITDEERDQNRGKLILWIVVGVAAALVIYYVADRYYSSEKHAEHEAKESEEKSNEYGYWDTFKRNRDDAKIISEARRKAETEAKAKGLQGPALDRYVDEAGRKAKQAARNVKVAGQDARFKAEEEAVGN